MRRMFGMATAGLCVVAMSGSLEAQVLNSVPNNAIVFVRVKNLQETSKKVGGLMQDWGLAGMQPALADPLAAMEGMGNLQQGLNRGGEAALAFMNPMSVPQDQQGGETPYVLMLPVSDYDAFVKNFDGAQVADGVAEITMPTDGQTAYMSKWGAFAAISPNKALITQRPQATKATGLTGQQLVDRDVAMYVNFNGFREQAAGYLGFGRMMATSQMDQNANATPEQAKYMPLAKVAINQMFNGFEHYINETQAITIGADFAPEGVQLTMMTEFMPDSYLGKLAAQWKAPQSKVGGGLPEGEYALVGTSVIDSATLLTFLDDAAGPVIAEAQKLGPDAKPILDYVDAMKEYWTATKSQNFGVSAGEGKPGESALFSMVMSMQGDAKAIMASQGKMAAVQNDFAKMVQMKGQPTSSMQVEKAAKTVGGVTFDRVVTTFQEGDAGGNAAANAQSLKMMEAIYGKGGFAMLLGPVDETTVLATTAKEEPAIAKAVAAAKADSSALSAEAMKQVAAQTPKNPIFSFYMYPNQMMQIVSRASQAFAGAPIETQIPAGTPPMAWTMGTEQTAVRMDFHVPSAMVKAVTSAAMQQAIKQQKQQDQGGDL